MERAIRAGDGWDGDGHGTGRRGDSRWRTEWNGATRLGTARPTFTQGARRGMTDTGFATESEPFTNTGAGIGEEPRRAD
ncbi:hypothetical protein GCM10027590_54170 [Nocardiopsis nanhaiensis]